MDHELFYVGQKAFIEKDGKVLVLINPHKEIDFPGGRVELIDKINITEALKREVFEETKLQIEVIRPFVSWSKLIKRDINVGKPLLVIGYHCKLASGDIVLSSEHNQHMWIAETDLNKLNSEDDYYQYLLEFFKYRQPTAQQV